MRSGDGLGSAQDKDREAASHTELQSETENSLEFYTLDSKLVMLLTGYYFSF